MSEDQSPFVERRISVLENSYAYLKDSMNLVVDKLDKILEQNTKVAVLTEKQASHQLDLERAALRITEVEGKHTALSTQVGEFISFIRGVTKLAYILWTSLGATVFLLLVKILFFAGKGGFSP